MVSGLRIFHETSTSSASGQNQKGARTMGLGVWSPLWIDVESTPLALRRSRVTPTKLEGFLRRFIGGRSVPMGSAASRRDAESSTAALDLVQTGAAGNG